MGNENYNIECKRTIRFDASICLSIFGENEDGDRPGGKPRANRHLAKHKGWEVGPILGLILLLVSSTSLRAERLPIKAYTTADGLPHNTVMRIVRDSRGFLWFCTLRRLARFDGYTFTTYGAEQGLRGQVTDLLETRQGEYWVGTLSGLYRFNPKPLRRDSPSQQSAGDRSSSYAPMFELYRLTSDTAIQGINTLHEDRRGIIWAATNAGLYRLVRSGSGWTPQLVDIAAPAKTANQIRVLELLEDHDGATWVSLPGRGVSRVWPDGRIDRYTTLGLHAGPSTASSFEGTVGPMLEDRNRRLWLGTDRGLSVLTQQPSSTQFELLRTYTKQDGLRDNNVTALLESADGNLWVGTSTGLSQLCAGAGCGKKSFRSYVTASLEHFGAWTLAEDREGNLWMGNEVGALRLARDGFSTYEEADGLGSSRVYSVAEDSSNRLYVVTQGAQRGDLNQLEGNHFRRVSPRLPKATIAPVPVGRQNGLQDHAGDWWVATDFGLVRYAGVKQLLELASTEPTAVYTHRNGLPFEYILGLYPDSHGDLWIGSLFVSTPTGALTRWQRATQTLRVYGVANGLTASTAPVSFCEDRSGNLWVGFIGHDLARYRDDHFTVFTAADGLPPGSIWSIYVDHAHRVWVATTEGGVARIDDPADDHPRFVTYTTAEGLSSNQVQAITEDQWGRIYLLTDRGVDRLDPQTGWIKHFTSADGLVNSSHWGVAFRDHGAALWFGTLQGLSRMIPKPDEPASAPAIRISAIRIRGEPYSVSELGEARIVHLVLEPNQNQIHIDFASLNFGAGEVLRYQYKLEGADRDWSNITEQRTVNYANLSPGTYRFLVRAINWKGMSSLHPAEVDFQVLPPLWQRWWFQTLVIVLIAMVLYAFYRSRLMRLLELEQVRMRIATDLHDDIGSSLTQISILSEVVRQKVGNRGQPVAEPLVRIGDLSRELVDSMSDIVWAINPRSDYLSDLTHRMRRFASDVLSARDIDFDFHPPDTNENTELRTDVRRQIFLVFKEGVNNIVRHSECKRVTIELAMGRNHLWLRLYDNGKGFDSTRPDGGQGHGLPSMAERAKNLGAELKVDSQPGQGTAITLRVPL